MFGQSLIGRSRIQALAAILIVCAAAIPLAAQEPRDYMIVNDDSDRLVIFTQGSMDDVLNLGLDIRIDPISGSPIVLVEDGDTVATSQGNRAVVGFGSSPDLNDSGMSVFMGGFGATASAPDDPSGQGIFRVTRTGTETLAVQAWGGELGTVLLTDRICQFEPMPAINNSGQLAFGFASDMPGGTAATFYPDCEDVDAPEAGVTQRKGVARWTSPSTLLKYLWSGDTVSVGVPYRASPATYTMTEIGFTHIGGMRFNDSGNGVAKALLDEDFAIDARTGAAETIRTYDDDRTGLFYLCSGCGTAGANYALIAATGPDSIFQEVIWPEMNNAGQVLFKGEERSGVHPPAYCGLGDGYCNETAASLNLWTLGGGRVAIVDTEVGTAGIPTSPPNSDALFQGFAPAYQLNEAGQIAFMGGLLIGGEEYGPDEEYQVVMFRDADGTLIEIARTEDAAQDDTGDGPFTSTVDGFRFEEIGGVTILTETGNVFFIAENYDGLPDNPCTIGTDPGWFPDGDELTAVVAWNDGTMTVPLREGGMYNGMRILGIQTGLPHLRDQTNDADSFFIKLILEDPATGDCVIDGDESFDIGLGGAPLGPAVSGEIPTMNWMGLALLSILLAAAALLVMKLAA